MTQASALPSVRPMGGPRPERPIPMSKRWWDLEWPAYSYEGISVEVASFDEATPFMAKHYPTIFATEPDRFLNEKMTDAKRRFLEESDVLVFRSGGADVGLCLGQPTDWSTYYVRSFALLPEVRDRRFASEFQVWIAATLKGIGVQRMEAETSPANVPMNRLFQSAGWMVTAMVNSERWGTALRYTRFLEPQAEEAFRRQYVSAPTNSRTKKTTT